MYFFKFEKFGISGWFYSFGQALSGLALFPLLWSLAAALSNQSDCGGCPNPQNTQQVRSLDMYIIQMGWECTNPQNASNPPYPRLLMCLIFLQSNWAVSQYKPTKRSKSFKSSKPSWVKHVKLLSYPLWIGRVSMSSKPSNLSNPSNLLQWTSLLVLIIQLLLRSI